MRKRDRMRIGFYWFTLVVSRSFFLFSPRIFRILLTLSISHDYEYGALRTLSQDSRLTIPELISRPPSPLDRNGIHSILLRLQLAPFGQTRHVTH